MADFIKITELAKRYTPNLFSGTSLINNDTTISFSGVAVSDNYTLSKEDSFTGNGLAFKANLFQDVSSGFGATFNFGDALNAIVDEQGSYLFQMSLKLIQNNGTEFVDLIVKPFINSIPQETFVVTLDVNELPLNKYVTFSQSINLDVDDEVSFSFEFDKDSVGIPNPNFSICIDGFKLEKNTYEIGGIGIPSIYTLPNDYFLNKNSLSITETQWDVTDIGTQVISDGSFINLLTLIDNSTDKNTINTDSFDELNIVSNSIITTYRNCKTIHTIRLSFNIISGSDQHYQIQLRRTIDNSVVARYRVSRDPDETIQTIEMTTRTLNSTDPYTIDGFYIAFVNNSGASCTIDDALSLLIINNYQKLQKND